MTRTHFPAFLLAASLASFGTQAQQRPTQSSAPPPPAVETASNTTRPGTDHQGDPNQLRIGQSYIALVMLNQLFRCSGVEPNGYFDGTADSNLQVPVLDRCTPHQLVLVADATITTQKGRYWNVWVDYNQDHDFNDADERVVANLLSSTSVCRGLTLTVPTTALAGPARMRVLLSSTSQPGGEPAASDLGYNEAEDYTISVGPMALAAPTGLLVTAASSTRAVALWDWQPNVSGYTLRYRIAGTDTWTIQCASSPCIVLNGLLRGTTYEAEVQGMSSCGLVGTFSPLVSFTTPVLRPNSTLPEADAAPAAIATAYPNPATDALHLTLTAADGAEAAPATVEIYDLRGARVAGATYDGNGSLNVSALTAGLYSATLRSENGTPAHVHFVKE